MQVVTIEELLRQSPRLSALPMHQIWAECVFLGKNIENRKRPIYRRGTILVYACVDRKGLKESLRIISGRPALRSILRAGVPKTFGALLGAVDILECTDNMHSDEWVGDWGFPRSFHWHLANPRRFAKPIACRPGSQGWFYVDAEFLEKQRERDVELA